MYEVEITAGADATLRLLPDVAAIGVLHKLATIEKTGVAQELKIGEINGRFDVHLLYAANYHLVSISDPSVPSIAITEIVGFAMTDVATKRRLADKAAKEIGVAVTSVRTL